MTNDPIRVAVMGCGHIGSYAVKAVLMAPDMILSGILELDCRLEEIRCLYSDVPVVDKVDDLPQKPDVVILCTPTRAVEALAVDLLTKGINTVDCFDMHGDPFLQLKAALDPAARKGGCTAVMGAGVDPGISTMIRALFEIWAPTGLTYVNFGPGMSMGHTVAAKSYPGVADAVSITRPGDPGSHKRDLYLQLRPEADFETVKAEILADPYFSHDDVRLFQVEDVKPLVDMGHRIHIFRKGGSSGIDNQLLTFETTFHNPASTAQVLVSAARAAVRLPSGAHTMLEIPLEAFLHEDALTSVRRLV